MVQQHEGSSNPLPAPEEKAVYVQQMFSQIARRYDLMNRLMTFGRDQAWRRYAVDQAMPPPGSETLNRPKVLDVATGTGDLAFEALRQQPEAQVTGLDFVPDMLALAQHKAEISLKETMPGTPAPRLALVSGDALKLPFPSASFDAIVTGFALRNVTDIPAAFREMARVTCPGGRLACLEIAKPRTRFFGHLFALYFYRIVPIVGGLITGQRSAYTYLPHSLTAFLTPDEIAAVMEQTGWQQVRYKRLMLGTVAVHTGVRAYLA
jgi:demethylmenaquinone methyltransferase/2-methoxy-6-polyprenyl-1,4-benzoquinol methylase